MTYDDWLGVITARCEFFEQERAMYREAAIEAYDFRPAPRKPWWQRLVDWWRGR